jgi:phage virion morphogenesis protein
MSETSGLEALEPWAEGFLSDLGPGERQRIFREVGRMLRARNAARIKANVDPDGNSMEPRRRHRDRRGRIRTRGRTGPMFRKISMARNMRITASADQVEIAFVRAVAGTAAVHHFGLTDQVDKRIPNSIRVRYAARRLLGLPQADRDAILDVMIDWLDKAGR